MAIVMIWSETAKYLWEKYRKIFGGDDSFTRSGSGKTSSYQLQEQRKMQQRFKNKYSKTFGILNMVSIFTP